MSIQDQAEQLRQLASGDQIPTGLLRESASRLESMQGEIQRILGGNERGLAINSQISLALEQINGAIAAVQQVETMTHDAADYHGR